MSSSFFDGQKLIQVDNQQLLCFGLTMECPLSNFFKHPFEVVCPWDKQIREVSTLEHAYQAFKSPYLEIGLDILDCKEPYQAKNMGTNISIRDDWDLWQGCIGESVVPVKVQIMFELALQKFQDKSLADFLTETENFILVEDAIWDPVWGAGPQGTGTNYLGRVLMSIRNYLQTKQLIFYPQTPYVPRYSLD